MSDRPNPLLPLRGTTLTGEVRGPVASLRLTLRFPASGPDGARPLAVHGCFPLPPDTALIGVTVRSAGEAFPAALQPRGPATAQYDLAQHAGRLAALVGPARPGGFHLRLTNLQPAADVEVELQFVLLACPAGRDWSLRILLPTPPPGLQADPPDPALPVPPEPDPGYRTALDLHFLEASGVRSPTHALALTPVDIGVRVRFAAGEVLPDRDCVLTWTPPFAADRPSLLVLAEAAAGADLVHALTLVTPPTTAPAERIPRQLTLLVDRSASMTAATGAAADAAVARFLAHLTEEDMLDLGLFHTETEWFSPEPVAATPEAVAGALAFLAEHPEGGETDLGQAVRDTLRRQRPRRGKMARSIEAWSRTPHLMIITDAQLPDTPELRQRVELARCMTLLCLGGTPNSFLATALAECGGSVHCVPGAPDAAAGAAAVDAILAGWDNVSPLLEVQLDPPAHDFGARGRGHLALNGSLRGLIQWHAWRVLPGDAAEILFRLLNVEDVFTPEGVEIAVARLRVGSATAHPTAGVKALVGTQYLRALEEVIRRAAPCSMRWSGYEQLAQLVAAWQAEEAERAPEEPDWHLKQCVTLLRQFRRGLYGSHELFEKLRELRLWGERAGRGCPAALATVLDLVDLRSRLAARGLSPDGVLPEPAAAGTLTSAAIEARLHEHLVQEALHYGLPTTETAFVALGRTAGPPATESVPRPGVLPAGWVEERPASSTSLSAGPPGRE